MKQRTRIPARTLPTIFRAASAGLAALVLGLCPLTASAQAVIGAACPTNGYYSGIGPAVNILMCRSLVWTAQLNIDDTLNNILVGTAATALPTAGSNTYIGYQAATLNTTGTLNTAIGTSALRDITINSQNTAVGNSALIRTTGFANTAIGSQAGNLITTGDNNIAIGYLAQVPTATASNQVRIGNTSITSITGQVAWSFPSDRRLKKDIQDSDLGLDFIKRLRPVSYRLKNGNDRLDYGFIAQELDKTLGGRVTKMVTQMGDDMKTYQLRGNDLIAPLVKAVQEQQQIIEKQQKQIDTLEKTIQRLF